MPFGHKAPTNQRTSDNVILSISTGGGIHQKVTGVALSSLKLELVVGRFLPLESVVENFLDRLAKTRGDKGRDQRLVEGLVARVARDLGRLEVPLVDVALGVDTKDGSVGRVDQLPELVGHDGSSGRRVGFRPAMLWLVAVLLPGSALAGVLTRSSGGHFGKIAEAKVVVIVVVGWHSDVI